MTIPKEFQAQIQHEAEMYGQDAGERITNVKEFLTHSCYEIGYVAGATLYATQLHTFQQENERLRKALEIIQKWQLPATGQFWDDDKTRPMSYAACYGSNGERNYMRAIANAALTAQPEADNQQKS